MKLVLSDSWKADYTHDTEIRGCNINLFKKIDKVPSPILQTCQLFIGISWNWVYDVRLHIAFTNEPECVQQVQKGI